jgi:hypothetical protein
MAELPGRISVTTDGYDGIHPTNSRGIMLRDGRSLRTWDWIVEPMNTQKEIALNSGDNEQVLQSVPLKYSGVISRAP